MIVFFKYPKGRPKNYFALQRTVLRWLGISFRSNESLLYWIYAILWLSSIVITYTVIELYEVYMHMNDMDTLVSILSYLGTDLLGVIKLGVLMYHRIELGTTLDNIEQGVFAPNKKRGGDEEEKLIKQCILISNRQTSLYYLSVIMVCVIGGVGTMLKRVIYRNHRTWELPFMPFSWFSVTSSPNFEIVWFYQFYWRTMYALIVSSTDSLIAGVLAHISSQCKILQNAIRRVVTNAYKEAFPDKFLHTGLLNEPAHEDMDPSKIPWPILEKHMKEMIDYHLAIIKLAETFEALFNMLVLCVFLATLFILCFIMYHASLFDLLSMRAAQDFSYVGVVTIQVFLYCFWGNEIRLASDNVSNACWDTNFVGCDNRFQKGLVLIIRRSQKPIVLTAGKFTPLSLQTYTTIIRASYSYYMVLRKHHSG